jgi:uncharacterized membrane protein YdcZ (DUF606 family)
MIVVGLGQIIAGTLLVLAGWMLAEPPSPDHPIIGVICMAYGAFTLWKAFDHIDPAGV